MGNWVMRTPDGTDPVRPIDDVVVPLVPGHILSSPIVDDEYCEYTYLPPVKFDATILVDHRRIVDSWVILLDDGITWEKLKDPSPKDQSVKLKDQPTKNCESLITMIIAGILIVLIIIVG